MQNNLKDFLQVKKINTSKKYPVFIDHLFSKIDFHINKWWRILVLTLTKKSSEEITDFLLSKWYKALYLHSEIDTLKRWEIIKRLKSWKIDILVWVNLLREWIDLPEVSLISMLDADKEGFLRSSTALIQNIWRAARNPDSEVVLYADNFTSSIIKALWETYRRRNIQINHNKKNNITPQKAISNIKDIEVVQTDETLDLTITKKISGRRLKRITKKEKEIILKWLKEQLDWFIAEWKFEEAALIRDQIKELSDE